MPLTRPSLIASVNKILTDEFEIPAKLILPNKALREDLDFDSLDAVDMLVALEQELGIRLPVGQLREMHSVGDIYKLVEAATDLPLEKRTLF